MFHVVLLLCPVIPPALHQNFSDTSITMEMCCVTEPDDGSVKFSSSGFLKAVKIFVSF